MIEDTVYKKTSNVLASSRLLGFMLLFPLLAGQHVGDVCPQYAKWHSINMLIVATLKFADIKIMC